MLDYLVTNYLVLIKYSLISCFTLFFLCEVIRPWARSTYSAPLRWWNTIPLYLVSYYLTVWVLPFTTIPTAIFVQSNAVGLLNLLDLHWSINMLIGILIYDLCHYGLHRVFHRIPLLWRLHRLHHSDPDVDIITELRHHPFEALVSVAVSVSVIFVLGIHPVSIIIREMFIQAISPMSHANIKLPTQLDKVMRLVFITPAMHRIHHSSWQPETDSNYSTLFSFWDRLFGTYVEQPRNGYENMQLGLEEFRSERDLWLDRMLIQPFIKKS